MSPQFYSLGMLITGRIDEWGERQTLSAMDLLADAISDEEKQPHPLIAFMFKESEK